MIVIHILKDVGDFIRSLDAKDGAACFRYIDRLKLFGASLRPPINEHLGAGLYTLRVSGKGGEFRVFYGFCKKEAFLLHIVHKKTQKLKQRDIDLAHERLGMVISGNSLCC